MLHTSLGWRLGVASVYSSFGINENRKQRIVSVEIWGQVNPLDTFNNEELELDPKAWNWLQKEI